MNEAVGEREKGDWKENEPSSPSKFPPAKHAALEELFKSQGKNLSPLSNKHKRQSTYECPITVRSSTIQEQSSTLERKSINPFQSANPAQSKRQNQVEWAVPPILQQDPFKFPT